MAVHLNFKCNESWENMSPSNSGKFCDNCSKNVFDLTNKSEEDIKKLYRENNGKMCGRIRSTQLYISPRKKRKYLLAQFCLALFLVFGNMLFSFEAKSQTLNTSSKKGAENTVSDSLKVHFNNEEETMMNGQILVVENKTITGVILDKDTKEPIPFVNVFYTYKDKNYGTVSNFDGQYKLDLPVGEFDENDFQLSFKFVGYNNLTIEKIDLKEKSIFNLDVQMEMSHTEFLGLIMIEEDPPLIEKDPEKQGETTLDREDIRRSPYR